MSRDGMSPSWYRQSEIHPLTSEEIAALKARFAVFGELRSIPDAPGYAVSEDGRVFSTLPCAWKRKPLDCPRELRQSTRKDGYKMLHLHCGKKAKLAFVHQIVAKTFLPAPTMSHPVVRHLNGDPSDNKVSNLGWGTQADNLADAVRHGRTLKGMKNPSARLNDRRVRIARELIEEGFSMAALAMFFGVSETTILRAYKGELWGHIDS